MFTRMVSAIALDCAPPQQPRSLSREGTSSAFEQSEEFAKWWGQWERRIERNRATPNKFTLSDGGQNRALAAERRLRPLVE
jgi:hypothetical protein